MGLRIFVARLCVSRIRLCVCFFVSGLPLLACLLACSCLFLLVRARVLVCMLRVTSSVAVILHLHVRLAARICFGLLLASSFVCLDGCVCELELSLVCLFVCLFVRLFVNQSIWGTLQIP